MDVKATDSNQTVMVLLYSFASFLSRIKCVVSSSFASEVQRRAAWLK